jgi:hypothetical protein
MARILTPATYAAIENPDVMEAALLTPNSQGRPKRDRFGPIKIDAPLAKKISAALLDFESYNGWGAQKGCITDDGARLRIVRGADEVHIRFCFECDILHIVRGDSEVEINFDRGHNRFAALFREVFPKDAIVERIPTKQ